jgi:hypothetical protein
MMNTKLKVVAALLALAVLAGVAILMVGNSGSHPAVTVTLRISVSPQDQSGFVAAQANSARFKYLLGKQAGVTPTLAQKLSVKPIPNSSILEAKVGVLTKEEGQRYATAFVELLQALCGKQVQIVLIEESSR